MFRRNSDFHLLYLPFSAGVLFGFALRIIQFQLPIDFVSILLHFCVFTVEADMVDGTRLAIRGATPT